MPVKVNWRYLGDAVYAKYDGFGILLHANDHQKPTDIIYLEPSTLKALNDLYEEKTKGE